MTSLFEKPTLPLFSFKEEVTDYKVMLEAVAKNGIVLQYASLSLRDNDTIAQTAIKCNSYAVRYISDRIKKKRDLMLSVVKENGEVLKWLPHFSDDKEFIEYAVKENGINIQYASDRLLRDKQLMLDAIKDNNAATKYLCDAFKDDIDIALASLSQNINRKGFFSQEIQDVYNQNAISGLESLKLKRMLEKNMVKKELKRKIKL